MVCQVDKNDHYRHILQFTFNQGCKAAKAVCDICAVCDDDTVPERISEKWFLRFWDENFGLTHTERTSRHVFL